MIENLIIGEIYTVQRSDLFGTVDMLIIESKETHVSGIITNGQFIYPDGFKTRTCQLFYTAKKLSTFTLKPQTA